MSELTNKLKSLITPIKSGSTGYVSLSCSKRVTAHKLNVIINELLSDEFKLNNKDSK